MHVSDIINHLSLTITCVLLRLLLALISWLEIVQTLFILMRDEIPQKQQCATQSHCTNTRQDPKKQPCCLTNQEQDHRHHSPIRVIPKLQ